MRGTGTYWAAAVLLAAGGSWAAQAPEAASPGDASGVAEVESRCPTFSWGEAEGADSYEIVVYRLGEDAEEAREVLSKTLPGSVESWTPALDSCLQRGDRYAWSVRAIGRREPSQWSAPSLFRVAAAPSQMEFEEALAVVRRYLEAGAAATDPDGSPLGSEIPAGSESPVSLATIHSGAPAPSAPAPTVLSLDGGVEAASFSGDGSALTSLDPTQLAAGTAAIDISGTAAIASNLVGTACVSESELTFDPATEAELGSHVADASVHHSAPTTLPPSGPAGGDLTGSYPDPAVVDEMARDTEVTASIGSHAGQPNVHHTPTMDTDTVLSEAQVEEFVTNSPLDGTNFTNVTAVAGDSASDFFSSGQIAEERIGDEIARDSEVLAAIVAIDRDCPGALGSGNRYSDCGNGTVRDNNTGLYWLKDASCADLVGTDVDGKGTWTVAEAAAAALADGTCGLTDGSSAGEWRQPTAAEFCASWAGSIANPCPATAAPESLIDSSLAGSPKVVNGAGDGQWSSGDAFLGVESSQSYWSGTEKTGLVDPSAWVASLSVGFVSFTGQSGELYVWPVRDGP